ncbi:MAG: Ppx/GppA phosphatase family protein [Geodermatophilaceae bacterium]
MGSNTVHLLVVDAYRGGHPTPTHSSKSVLRLAENLTRTGSLSKSGEQSLVDAVARGKKDARNQGCDDLLAFATSAVRDASNSAAVLARVQRETGVELAVLSGAEEARLTFLAVRRWYGWSAGRLLALDIGGGSLEMAVGVDEEPELAISVPLGAGRMAREFLRGDPPDKKGLTALREHAETVLAKPAKNIAEVGPLDRIVATSKTFRSLARLTGAARSSAGPRVTRHLTLDGLGQLIGFISRISSADLAELDGVSGTRAHQLLAGAVVAEVTMRMLGLGAVQICPWALREGVILRRLDWLEGV